MPDFKKDLDELFKEQKSRVLLYLHRWTEEKDWERALEIADSTPRSMPFSASILTMQRDRWSNLSEFEEIVSEGEGEGLRRDRPDFFRIFSTGGPTQEIWRADWVGKELGLPIVVHDQRGTSGDPGDLKIGEAEGVGIIHCFSGDYKMQGMPWDGFYISVSGAITFKNAEGLKEVIERLPLECLVVEQMTLFSPVPFRGKRNEPSYVRYSAEILAEVKKVSFEKVAEVTTQNALRVFRLKCRNIKWTIVRRTSL